MLRLMKKLCSKYFAREIFLVATLALTVIFTSIIVEPVDTYLGDRAQIRRALTLDRGGTLHFAPSVLISWSAATEGEYLPEVHETMKNQDGVEAVLEMFTTGGAFSELNGETVNFDMFALYSEDFANRCPPWPGAGSDTGGSGGRLPVKVSETAAERLPVGSEFELKLYNILSVDEETGTVEDETLSVPCVVAGVLEDGRALPWAGSSHKALGGMGYVSRYFQDTMLVAAVYDPEFFGDIRWDYPAFIVPKNGADVEALEKALSERLGGWGEVCTLDGIERGAFENTLSENLPEQLKFILLALVALFGYGAYLFLSIRRRERQLAVFYISGMTKGRIFYINLLVNVLIYGLSAIIDRAATPLVAKAFVYAEDYRGAGALGAICAGALFLMALLMSLAAGIVQNRNAAAITLYHRGD